MFGAVLAIDLLPMRPTFNLRVCWLVTDSLTGSEVMDALTRGTKRTKSVKIIQAM